MIEWQGTDMDIVQLKINQNMQSKHNFVQTFQSFNNVPFQNNNSNCYFLLQFCFLSSK